MSQVIALDVKGNKNFVTKSKIEVESSVFVGEYCVREAYYKKLKKELLMLIEKETICIWVVVKVKSYYQKIGQYENDRNETEFRQGFKLLP